MSIKVVFKGVLKKLCPLEYSVNAKTPSEAIRAVTNQLKDKLIKPNGTRWVCRVKGYETADSLKSVCEDETTLEIYPDFRASGLFSWVKIVVGVVLVVVGLVFQVAPLVSLGASLVLSGIADLLAPSAPNGNEEEASRYFGHRQNTTLIGTRIPIAYGKNKIYGHLLSLNTDTGSNQVEKYELKVETSGGNTITGVTPTNPNLPYTPEISDDGSSATIEVPKDSEVIVEVTKPSGEKEEIPIIVEDNKTEVIEPKEEETILVGSTGGILAVSFTYAKGDKFDFYDTYTGEKYISLSFERSSEEMQTIFSTPNEKTYFSPVDYVTSSGYYLQAEDSGYIYKNGYVDYPSASDVEEGIGGPYRINVFSEENSEDTLYAVGYVFFAVEKKDIDLIRTTGVDTSVYNVVLTNEGICYSGTISPYMLKKAFPSEDYFVTITHKVLYSINKAVPNGYSPYQALLTREMVVPYKSSFNLDTFVDGWLKLGIIENIGIGDKNIPFFVKYSSISKYLELINSEPQEETEFLYSSTTRVDVVGKYSLEESDTLSFNDVLMRVIWVRPDYLRKNPEYSKIPYEVNGHPVTVCGTVQVVLVLNNSPEQGKQLIMGVYLPTESQEEISNL